MTTTHEQIDASYLMTLDRDYVMGTYGRQPIVFVRGEGAHLWDAAGKEYLDFLSGISVAGVGHCHPRVAKAIADQAHKLLHVSNLFYNELQPVLAQRLTRWCGMEKAFFCNSGAEANEAAIKIARKWAKKHRGPDCHEIITFKGSFHGRTLATVTATAQPKYQEAFTPLPKGFKYLEIGDIQALDAAMDDKTCAVMIEPIQGESGIRIVPPEFLTAMRALCDEAGILLILDEVQSGMGRTGCFLASHRTGVHADIVTLAKSVAAGVPMGVCLARGEASRTLVPGDHGSTFGGQPLACAAALAVLDVIEDEDLMDRASDVGAHFLRGLTSLQVRVPEKISEVRGVGLMIGVELAQPVARQVLTGLLDRGVVANAVGDTVIRFLPPLVISEADCDRVVDALGAALEG